MTEALLRAMREQLATQQAELATLRDDHAALRAQLARAPRRQLRHRLVRTLPSLTVALLVALVPLSVLATNPFTDLNAGSVHNPNIDAIFNAGITTGCDPGVAYCPNAFVTREEMASFLARTAGLGSNPPVANALTAQTAVNATNAQTAANATQLGGQPASAYLHTSGDLVFRFSPLTFRTDDTNVVFTIGNSAILEVGTTSTSSDRQIFLPLDVPATLFGIPLKVKAVEICSASIGTGPQPFITRTVLYDTQAANSISILDDPTDRTEGTCYTVTLSSPVALQGTLSLRLLLTFPNMTQVFDFTRLSVMMTP